MPRERLHLVLDHMKERIAGKMANRSDNAFRLRRLFKMYDTEGTGLISTEDFRVMTESFGMQLDDDSLLAVFAKVGRSRLSHAGAPPAPGLPLPTTTNALCSPAAQTGMRPSPRRRLQLLHPQAAPPTVSCAQYDKECIGRIEYQKLMEDVLDDDLLALYKGSA